MRTYFNKLLTSSEQQKQLPLIYPLLISLLSGAVFSFALAPYYYWWLALLSPAVLVTLAKAELKRLAEQSQESVALMVPSNGQAICIELVDSPQPLRCCYQKGLAQPLLVGASARVLLAYMDEAQSVSALLAQGVEPEEVATYQRSFAQIRAAGYAVSVSEIDDGIWGISAPLLDSRNRLQGAISLMAPASRAHTRSERLIRWTQDVALRLSARLD